MRALCRCRIAYLRSFSRCHLFLEVGDTGLYEDVIPRDELLDMAVLHAILIPFGQHFGEVGAELFAAGFLLVDAGFLATLELLEVLKYIHQGHVVGLCVHSDIGQRGDTVGGKGGHAAMSAVEGLDDEVVVTSGHEFVKAGLSGNC